jgi:hypothetical protein
MTGRIAALARAQELNPVPRRIAILRLASADALDQDIGWKARRGARSGVCRRGNFERKRGGSWLALST